VLVVGAVIAGLTAANALTGAGVECVVLEARERLGGRLHTADAGGLPADLGGSWIHTPEGNPLRAFAGLAGVPCRSANPLPEMACYDAGEGRRLSGAETGANLGLLMEEFPAAQEGLVAELGPAASAADGIGAFVAGAGLDPGPARRARQGLHALVEAEAADLAERQSLRWMWHEAEYGGHYSGDVPEGGCQRLTGALGAGLGLRPGVAVTDVACTAGGVRVRTADGRWEEGPARTSRRALPPPTRTCWESRPAGGCCSPGSTPRAPGWPTPTAP
jgi:polyamine oxidase